MRAKTIFGNPSHIGYLHSIRGFDRATQDAFSVEEVPLKQGTDLSLQATLPILTMNQNDLTKAVGFDLVGQIFQTAILADVFPSAHGQAMPPRPLSRNTQFSCS
jgi:hypothetical protein